MTTQPNILFFFTDQQRPDSIGCYGQELNTTPVLDAMAADGLRFDRAYTPNPVCGPARASLQTGRYPASTGNHVNNVHLAEDYNSLAKLLNTAGYQTGYLGKWHLASTGANDGPDSFRTIPIPERRRGGYKDYWLAADALEWTSHGYGGFMFDADGKAVTFDNKVYRVDFMTDHLLEAIDQLAKNEDNDEAKPFFMMASYLEPHQQNDTNSYDPPRKLRGKYDNAAIPADIKNLKGNWHKHYSNYLGCVESLDGALGRVLNKLDELGIRDNTIVIFATDHGCHFATRNGEYKRSCHDASIHIPLVISGPGFEKNATTDKFANLLDIPATILHAAGSQVPAGWHGRPLQLRDADDWRDCHMAQISESQIGRCLRTERWTYSVRVPGTPWKKLKMPAPASSDTYVEDFLYDNEADPHQQHNLAADPAFAEIRAELKDKLIAEMIKAGEEAPTIIPADGPGPDPVITGTAASRLED